MKDVLIGIVIRLIVVLLIIVSAQHSQQVKYLWPAVFFTMSATGRLWWYVLNEAKSHNTQ